MTSPIPTELSEAKQPTPHVAPRWRGWAIAATVLAVISFASSGAAAIHALDAFETSTQVLEEIALEQDRVEARLRLERSDPEWTWARGALEYAQTSNEIWEIRRGVTLAAVELIDAGVEFTVPAWRMSDAEISFLGSLPTGAEVEVSMAATDSDWAHNSTQAAAQGALRSLELADIPDDLGGDVVITLAGDFSGHQVVFDTDGLELGINVPENPAP